MKCRNNTSLPYGVPGGEGFTGTRRRPGSATEYSYRVLYGMGLTSQFAPVRLDI